MHRCLRTAYQQGCEKTWRKRQELENSVLMQKGCVMMYSSQSTASSLISLTSCLVGKYYFLFGKAATHKKGLEGSRSHGKPGKTVEIKNVCFPCLENFTRKVHSKSLSD